MSRIVHTNSARVGVTGSGAAITGAATSVAGSIVSLTGITTLSASASAGAGITAVASAVSGNAGTITLGGTPKAGDIVTATVNGQTVSVAVASLAWTTAMVAAELNGKLQLLISGDLLAYFQANRGVVQTTTTLANCTTAGLPYFSKSDPRNTTSGPVINDSETSVP